MASLQDQLLKAGMVDSKKAKSIKKEKYKKQKQQVGKLNTEDDSKILAKKALAEKAQRGREKNVERQREMDKKALRAQVIELIERHKVARENGESAFQFSDGKKIKKMLIIDKQVRQLVNGHLAIVKSGQNYELVPAIVAERIQDRDPETVLCLNRKDESHTDEDDPYAEFEIPDDLMW